MGAYHGLVGGLDVSSGGTWLAVDRARSTLAVLVNGVETISGPPTGQLSRGELPLWTLANGEPPGVDRLRRTGGFHLLLAAPDASTVWSWDGAALRRTTVDPGDHVLVFHGLDAEVNPRATYARTYLDGLDDPDPDAWGAWRHIPTTLLQQLMISGRAYGSTSVSLVALRPGANRYEFTADPRDPTRWRPVRTEEDAHAS
jgi:hypothetical protein